MRESVRRSSWFARATIVAVVALATAALAAFATPAVRGSAGPPYQTGAFALLGGTPQIVSHFWGEDRGNSKGTLFIQQFRKDGKTPIVKYDVDMTKYMHLIVVRDDFNGFWHLHPELNGKTGTFSAPFTKQPDHRFFVYADSLPAGLGQQVFRFTIDADGPQAPVKPSLSASLPHANAGPYIVILQKTTIAANTPQNLDITVTVDDDPAEDLVPYLGAAAHVVLIDTKTLQYVHVHPMLRGQSPMPMGSGSQMSMEQMEHQNPMAGAFMKMMLPALPAGSYKVWVQVAGGPKKQVYTAAFTLVAR